MTRATVTYHGRVQGVGFRASATILAGAYPVTGFVCNQSDGSVRLVAEGREKDVQRFLEGISASRLGALVTRSDVAFGPAHGNFDCFEPRVG